MSFISSTDELCHPYACTILQEIAVKAHLWCVRGGVWSEREVTKSCVVYHIPCIVETIRRLETRMKEHQNACKRGETERSTIVEHAWSEHHQIDWEGEAIVDRESIGEGS